MVFLPALGVQSRSIHEGGNEDRNIEAKTVIEQMRSDMLYTKLVRHGHSYMQRLVSNDDADAAALACRMDSRAWA